MRELLTAAAITAALLSVSTAGMAQTPSLDKWRPVDPQQTLYIDTNKGRVVVEMYPEIAPLAVERVKTLTRERFYDGLQFHRVIENFMAQTGDPLNTGEGGSKLPDLTEEFLFRRGADMPLITAANQGGAVLGYYKALPIASQPDDMMAITKDQKAAAWGLHCKGVAAMARATDPNSANSQFYLMRATYPSLDKRYTIWGRVIWGQDVVDQLAVGEPPPIADRMLSVRIAADLPEAERAPLYVLRTDGRDFAGEIEDHRNRAGADFSVCDIPIPATVANTQQRERSWWRLIPFVN